MVGVGEVVGVAPPVGGAGEPPAVVVGVLGTVGFAVGPEVPLDPAPAPAEEAMLTWLGLVW